jgi:predicted  nucleic acid-binding Zn-ribbon protein
LLGLVAAKYWKPLAFLGVFLLYSTGVYWGGKYAAYKEMASVTSSKVLKETQKQAKQDVQAADKAVREIARLQGEVQGLQRKLHELEIDIDRTGCDLTDDELRVMGEIINKTNRQLPSSSPRTVR